MPSAHLYFFSDACPSDWLVDGQDDTWHTIVNVVFQSAPDLQSHVERGVPHIAVLELDPYFREMIEALKSGLNSGVLRKWKTGPSYHASFCRAFSNIWPKYQPLVSACSFQERALRQSKAALLNAYNTRIGGLEGRGISFREYVDRKGRLCMRHEFVDITGHHEFACPENQILVLLFMSWFVADQHAFYVRDIVASGRHGFDQLTVTVVSDKLSGDDDSRRVSEHCLRWLIDPETDGTPILLTRSPQSDEFAGDLLADNLAGWLNDCVSNPSGECWSMARGLEPFGAWSGWHVLAPSSERLRSVPAVIRLRVTGTV